MKTACACACKPRPENRGGGRSKQRAIIFHVGRVIVNSLQKLVVIATRVVKGKIQMIPSDSPGPQK